MDPAASAPPPCALRAVHAALDALSAGRWPDLYRLLEPRVYASLQAVVPRPPGVIVAASLVETCIACQAELAAALAPLAAVAEVELDGPHAFVAWVVPRRGECGAAPTGHRGACVGRLTLRQRPDGWRVTSLTFQTAADVPPTA